MDLLLVRHAIAAERDPVAWPDDSLRPLTEEGERRFRPAARGLHRVVPTVELVLASPYARAWRTAELLHDEAGWPSPEACDALAAAQSPAAGLEAVRARAPVTPVALVGHEPYLSSLAALLLVGDQAALHLELKKGGALLLAVNGAPAPGRAALRWHATPRILRALAS